jgi:SNF2 family DNA or RNA helicase
MQLYDWQKKAVEENRNLNSYAFLADPGTGKTCAMINVLREKFNSQKKVMKTLIVGPVVTLYNWRNEILKFSKIPEQYIEILKGSRKNRCERLQKSTAKIFITNYESFVCPDFTKVATESGFEVLILDESHYCKSPDSKRSKNIYAMSQVPRYKYIMTGTLIPNTVMDIFMQFKILDGGETFGDNPFVFRSKYMRDANEGWKGRQNYFPKWVARADKFEELQEKIYRKGIRVTTDECLDLPELIEKTYPVELSTSQKRYYNQMMRDFVTFIEEGNSKGIVTAEMAMTKALRLQQIVTGFVQTEEGQVIEIKDNPRLDAVEELLSALHDKHKVILWCSFKHNYRQLEQVCKKLGIKYVFLTGEQNAKEKDEAITSFESDDSVRVIIANRRAGGIGINLVAASYSIVYSRNFSLEEEIQSKARNYRGGSERHKSIVKIDLCAVDTLDEHITETLKQKKKVSDAIVEYALNN